MQITYKYLPSEAEPTDDELSKAELVSIRRVEDGEKLPRQDVAEIIQVPDYRHGGEERRFKIVKVSATPTVAGFVGEFSTMIDHPAFTLPMLSEAHWKLLVANFGG